ncbi:MAG: carbohydrate ABC transporter permease [Jatrophihabitans sp.]|uniref:carbohydrate ABC transporter permease n=1 Tax=Jatrophihabitans sp. TaxID=1932789 RepID=UPI00391606C5
MLGTLWQALENTGVGIGATVALFVVLNRLGELLPVRWEQRAQPYLFIGPALVLVGVLLVWPTLQTIAYSFANSDSTRWVGLGNYRALLVDGADGFHATLANTLLWLAAVPVATVVLGLLVAALADRLRPRAAKAAKTVIFLPMAIGAVGVATIWRLVFAPDPQLGLQNAVWHGLLGQAPVAWLQDQRLHLNTFELMIMMLWGVIGFAMVLLSAAINGVPPETVEAARIDGATESQVFFLVVVPQIRTTLATVFVTVLVSTLKIFDIVYVTTNGNFDTNIIGLEFFNQQNAYQNNGYAATIVVILLLAVAPVMAFQVRRFRDPGAVR